MPFLGSSGTAAATSTPAVRRHGPSHVPLKHAENLFTSDAARSAPSAPATRPESSPSKHKLPAMNCGDDGDERDKVAAWVVRGGDVEFVVDVVAGGGDGRDGAAGCGVPV